MEFRQAEVVVAAISRSDAELATKSDLKAEIAGVKAEIASLKADLEIIKYFFGPVIVLLPLKIAFL